MEETKEGTKEEPKKEGGKLFLSLDQDEYIKVLARAEKEHLTPTAMCRRIVLLFIDGRLVEANGHRCVQEKKEETT